jgi:hypothetical protein
MTYHRTAGTGGTRQRKVGESCPTGGKSTAGGYTRKPRKGRSQEKRR